MTATDRATKDYATIARALDAITNAAGRLQVSRRIPENWRIDAGTLLVDIQNLRRDHSIDFRARSRPEEGR